MIWDGTTCVDSLLTCPCLDMLLDSLCIYLYWNLKTQQLHEFAIYNSWRVGNERWQLSKFDQFTDVYCADLNPNSYDINNMKVDLNVSTKVKFNAYDHYA